MNNFDLIKYLREGKLYENLDNVKSIEATYTDGGDFYRVDINYKDGTSDYFKNLDKAGVKLPYRYNDVDLEKIKNELKDKGIKFDYNDAFDPS